MKLLIAAAFAVCAVSAPATALAEKDSAACLSECTKKFTKCKESGTALATCLAERKKCIESCA